MPITDTEYAEDADRIEREYIDPSSTSEDDLEADLRDNDFAEGAIKDIKEWFTTSDDVSDALGEPHSDGVTTREEIEGILDDQSAEIGNTSRKEEIVSEVARDVGAPTPAELRRAQAQAIGGADDVTPEDSSTTVSLIKGPDGEPAAVVGGTSRTGPEAAEEHGVSRYASPQEFADSLSTKPAPDGRRALLYANGDPVGEVSLE
ncbi:hypothetical protein GCM10009536_64900 [Streptomyces thermocarboxydus]|uniref:hypothetical protein n=1 Tax=Streptomyces thermocarboxydus TaxID=59299 RepID=UPI0031F7B14F